MSYYKGLQHRLHKHLMKINTTLTSDKSNLSEEKELKLIKHRDRILMQLGNLKSTYYENKKDVKDEVNKTTVPPQSKTADD